MSNGKVKNRIKDKIQPEAPQVVLKSSVLIGLTAESRFIWKAKNVANLFEVLGYLDLAREEVKKTIRGISNTR